MRNLLIISLLASAVAAAPHNSHQHHHQQAELEDDDCSMVWITLGGDEPTGSSSLPAATPTSGGKMAGGDTSEEKVAAQGQEASSTVVSVPSAAASESAGSSAVPDAGSANTTDTSSAVSLPNLPNGEAAIPINDNHLSAPEDTTPVPADAVVYTPKQAGVFDLTDFSNWLDALKKADSGPKFMKVKPGAYHWGLGPKMAEGTDGNTVAGENIVIYLMKGGWTLDLRGVTFYVDVTPENHNQRPGVMIYVLQSDNFSLLGGTIWIDQGEPHTQAKCTHVAPGSDPAVSVATFVVDQGYNVSAWRTAGPRNQGCVDVTNPEKYAFGECNFWHVSDYDFSALDSARTFTVKFDATSKIKEGIVVTMQVGPNSMIAVSNEDNGGLKVHGMTTNGNFMSIGLNSGLVPPQTDHFYQVNPPPRPGFAPRVMGPALSWGNIGGFVYNAPGQARAVFTDSYWQYLAGSQDLQVGGDDSKPPGL